MKGRDEAGGASQGSDKTTLPPGGAWWGTLLAAAPSLSSVTHSQEKPTSIGPSLGQVSPVGALRLSLKLDHLHPQNRPAELRVVKKELRVVRVWRRGKGGLVMLPHCPVALWAPPISAFKAPLLPGNWSCRIFRETYFLASSVFSNFLNLRYSICQGVIFCG